MDSDSVMEPDAHTDIVPIATDLDLVMEPESYTNVPPKHEWVFPYNDWDLNISLDGVDEQTLPEEQDNVVLTVDQIAFTIDEPTYETPLYSSNCPDLLPLDAPLNHVHLLEIQEDTGELHGRNSIYLHIADVVATVLHNHDVNALDDFLRNEVKDFAFVYVFRKLDEEEERFVIQRHKDYVMIGNYERIFGSDGKITTIKWLNQIVYRIRKSGAWTPFRASQFRSTPVAGDVLLDALKEGQYKAEKGTDDVQEIVFNARMMANYLMHTCPYPRVRDLGREWRYDITAEGQDKYLASVL